MVERDERGGPRASSGRKRPGGSGSGTCGSPDDIYVTQCGPATRGGPRSHRGPRQGRVARGASPLARLESGRGADPAGLAVGPRRSGRGRRGGGARSGFGSPILGRLPAGLRGPHARVGDRVDARRLRRADHERRGAHRDHPRRAGGFPSRFMRSGTGRQGRARRVRERGPHGSRSAPPPHRDAQLLAPDDLARFSWLGVAASVQFSHAPRSRSRPPLLGRQDGRRVRLPLAPRIGRRRRQRLRRSDQELDPLAGIRRSPPDDRLAPGVAPRAGAYGAAGVRGDGWRRGGCGRRALAGPPDSRPAPPGPARPRSLGRPRRRGRRDDGGGRWVHNPPPWTTVEVFPPPYVARTAGLRGETKVAARQPVSTPAGGTHDETPPDLLPRARCALRRRRRRNRDGRAEGAALPVQGRPRERELDQRAGSDRRRKPCRPEGPDRTVAGPDVRDRLVDRDPGLVARHAARRHRRRPQVGRRRAGQRARSARLVAVDDREHGGRHGRRPRCRDEPGDRGRCISTSAR